LLTHKLALPSLYKQIDAVRCEFIRVKAQNPKFLEGMTNEEKGIFANEYPTLMSQHCYDGYMQAAVSGRPKTKGETRQWSVRTGKFITSTVTEGMDISYWQTWHQAHPYLDEKGVAHIAPIGQGIKSDHDHAEHPLLDSPMHAAAPTLDHTSNQCNHWSRLRSGNSCISEETVVPYSTTIVRALLEPLTKRLGSTGRAEFGWKSFIKIEAKKHLNAAGKLTIAIKKASRKEADRDEDEETDGDESEVKDMAAIVRKKTKKNKNLAVNMKFAAIAQVAASAGISSTNMASKKSRKRQRKKEVEDDDDKYPQVHSTVAQVAASAGIPAANTASKKSRKRQRKKEVEDDDDENYEPPMNPQVHSTVAPARLRAQRAPRKISYKLSYKEENE
jgi:hypothetical protein